MEIYICKLFSLNSKSKSGLEKMKTIQISPVITSRDMAQLTGEQRVFIVLSYTRTREHLFPFEIKSLLISVRKNYYL